MAALKHLRNLNVSHNQLTSFPSFACQIATLDYLDLSHNMIDSLPSCLETMKVVEMNLNNNKVQQLPASLAQCPRLKVLRVEQNELTISGIPEGLLMDSKVSLLAVEGNYFSMKDLEEIPGYDKVLWLLEVYQFIRLLCVIHPCHAPTNINHISTGIATIEANTSVHSLQAA